MDQTLIDLSLSSRLSKRLLKILEVLSLGLRSGLKELFLKLEKRLSVLTKLIKVIWQIKFSRLTILIKCRMVNISILLNEQFIDLQAIIKINKANLKIEKSLIANIILIKIIKGQMNPEQKISYIQCNKQGYHFGQVLNMVCTEQSCLQNLVCCCACVEQQHRSHTTKPLRMIMKQAKTHSDKIKPVKFNIDVIIDIINSSQKQTLDLYLSYKKQIIQNLDTIQKSLLSYFSFLIQQVKLKNSDPKLQIHKAFQTIHSPKNITDFKQSVKKVVAMLPNPQSETQTSITESDFIASVNTSTEQINKMIKKNIDQVNKKLTEYQASIQANINAQNLWKKVSFKFSSTLKHNDIKVVSDYLVKSQNSAGYKFAIMQPDLQKGGKIKNLAFKIKQCTSNWVAVGMCHKNIVVGKSYGFNFSSIGHGGYMISANGGSWSNTKFQANNCVKAFKFATNDIITLTIDFQTKKMLFKKKNEKYELEFSTIQGDALYPCALFYYMNDEVEFLPDYKE